MLALRRVKHIDRNINMRYFVLSYCSVLVNYVADTDTGDSEDYF